jgi:hypothetical protein
LDAAHDLLNLLLARNTILERPALWVTGTREIGVHETQRDAVSVEQGSRERDAVQNKAQVLDTASLLLKLHGTTVVFELLALSNRWF